MTVGIIESGYLYKELISSLIKEGIKVPFVVITDKENITTDLSSVIDINKIVTSNIIETTNSADIILLFDYNKILDVSQFDHAIVINLHSGLLPKWRGLSCNAWGVINGENKLGYTIHRVTNVLDGGGIYYRYEYEYLPTETFSESRPRIYNHFVENIPLICKNIFEAPDFYIDDNCEEFVYCSKLKKEDSFIFDWNIPTDTLLRKFYFFAPPIGTGLKFIYKGIEYNITRVSPIPDFAKSIGVPGSIVYKNGDSLWIKTKDTAISIDEIQYNNNKVNNNFKIGFRL